MKYILFLLFSRYVPRKIVGHHYMFLEALKDNKIKDLMKEFIRLIVEILYNDVYFYICIISIYSILSFIILLAILYSSVKHLIISNRCPQCNNQSHNYIYI
jgi:hypothetical protein